jgi:hypothetical protein
MAGPGSPRHLARVIAMACGLWLLGAPHAEAERVVLLPQRGDEALGPQRDEAQRALEHALSALGDRLIAHADAVAAAAGGAGSDCETLDCAAFLIRAARAELAVSLAIWADPSGGAPVVTVTLVDAEGARFPGKAQVDPAGVEEAARRALMDARALRALGPGPWLRVQATPAGAEVLLDGEPVGTTPYRATVAPGRHAVEIRHPGYRPHLQTVDVSPAGALEIALQVQLEPRTPETARETPGPAAAPSAGPRLGPLLLGGAGLIATLVDVVLLARTGCERRGLGGACAQEVTLDDGVAVGLAVGGVGAMIGAGLWSLLDDEAAPARQSLRVRGGLAGVTVEGRF